MSVLTLTRVSRWYGNIVAVNDVTMTIGPGVTGLLGPNGAGKSTLINLMAGFLAPSSGTVTLDGAQIWQNPGVYRLIGLVPEREAMYDMVTGWQFVLANAKLHRLPNPKQAAEAALAQVDMLGPKDRQIAGYSKGMKQRVKMAASLVHQPAVLLLDEPFNGMDPMQREHLMDLMRGLGSAGYTVLFSSHVLEEVEQIAQNIEVVVTGRHAASGDFRAIRRLMTERPLQYKIASSNNRWLAAALVGADQSGESVQAIDLQPSSLNVEVRDVVRFSHALPALARSGNVQLYDVTPADESLESVFTYLVNRQIRSAR